MMWYPVIFVLSAFMVLAIVVRRALVLGPAMTEEEIELSQLQKNSAETKEDIEKWRRAEELFRQNKYFAAEKLYKDVAFNNPNSDKAWARLGAIALTQKRYADAAQAFEKSVNIDSSVPSRYYNLALSYYLIGKKNLAVNAIDVAISEAPEKDNYLDLKKKIASMD